MSDPDQNTPSFSARKRWLVGLNSLLGMTAVFALVVMANYVGSGYFKRFQWTTTSKVELSGQTRRVLDELTNRVNVTIFFNTQEEQEIYDWVSTLLKEYSYYSRNVVVRTVDYARYPAEAELTLAKYNFSSQKESDFVIFEVNGRTKRHFRSEMVDLDLNPLIRGETKEIRRTGFRGEMIFTSAIYAVTQLKQPKAYFLVGHAEHNPELTQHDHGYARFASMLAQEKNVEWAKLNLMETNDVPADCQLLIIAGPKSALDPERESAKIEKYLRQGGRLLMLFNNTSPLPSIGLEAVLGKWGIGTAPYKIYEQEKDFVLTGPDFLAAHLNPQHPITRTLVAEDQRIRMVLPRAVGAARVAAGADSPKVVILAQTTTNALGMAPGKTTAERGGFPLIAAVEQGSIRGVSTGARLVVVGDSLCFNNQLIDTAANHYFAGFVIDWLLARPDAILSGLGPRLVKTYQINPTEGQLRNLKLVLLAGMPGAVLIIGLLIWARRRR